MPDKYYYELNDGGPTVIVVDEPGPFNTWSSEPANNCLIFEGGGVEAESDGMVLRAGASPYPVVLKLLGASWDSQAGDEGDVEADLTDGCRPDHWYLRRVE